MIDWYAALVASDYRRDELEEKTRLATLAREAANHPEDEEPVERKPLLGALGLALVALVATGAIAPR